MSLLPETRERTGFADQAEVDDFVRTLARFERAEITADQWRAYRLVRGIYGQRQEGVQMVRCKIPQGILPADQLRALAAVARRYSRGFGHITTRQNVQFHFVRQDDAPRAMRLLAEAGLTTREACGNSVRNITACVYAGVAADEVFDITPFAEACTRHLLRHPLSAVLPRKFKIAWEGCLGDHVALPIHDLGFWARRGQGGVPGFQVLVGGGTSILCRGAREIEGFLPAEDVLRIAEAVLRVYHQRGDYRHKQRNRLKFLIEEMGFASFAEEDRSVLGELRAEGGAELPFDARRPPVEAAPPPRPAAPAAEAIAARVRREPPRGPGLLPVLEIDTQPSEADLARWLRTNLRPQKQPGFSLATVTVVLGDLTAPQLEALAELAVAYGDGTVRVTSEQNLVLRFVPT
ncbi:MAG TPA: nitrite/sulfite reductase, partial [Vicinamibacteria bacterium]|nr:nitrite/sulfite reductase [Vicinamibacteria bacterium]